MRPGNSTGIFGKEITEKYKQHIIYYDHGVTSENVNVVACKGFYGDEVKNANRLTDIDLIIADSDGVLKVLIEIEERYCSPKKIIGDIFSIAMCNKIAIRNGSPDFKITNETILIIGGVVPTKGIRKNKIDNIISERIKIFKREDDGLDLNKVELYFEENIENTFAQIRLKLNKVLIK